MCGSGPPFAPPDAACMPFRAPLAEGVVLFAPLVGAGEPWACACVVCAGEFWDENLELILVIHEFRRELVLPSGGVVPDLSLLLRPSRAGRFGGVFRGGVAVAGSTAGAREGGDEGCCGCGGVASWCCWPFWFGRDGRPPCDDVLGGASRVRPGDEGACWRWWCS